MKKIFYVIGIIALLAMASCSEDGADPTATLTLVNNSSYTIDEFYCILSSSSDPGFGADLLNGTIAPGSSQDFTIPAGTVDMDAEENTATYYWVVFDQITVSGDSYTWTLIDDDATEYQNKLVIITVQITTNGTL